MLSRSKYLFTHLFTHLNGLRDRRGVEIETLTQRGETHLNPPISSNAGGRDTNPLQNSTIRISQNGPPYGGLSTERETPVVTPRRSAAQPRCAVSARNLKAAAVRGATPCLYALSPVPRCLLERPLGVGELAFVDIVLTGVGIAMQDGRLRAPTEVSVLARSGGAC